MTLCSVISPRSVKLVVVHNYLNYFRQDGGWPFNTSLTSRVRKYRWVCYGPIQHKLPDVCSNDGITLKGDVKEAHNQTCTEKYVIQHLTREECISGVLKTCAAGDECVSDKLRKGAEIDTFCNEKEKFWKLENTCKTRNPLTMYKKMRLQCKCKYIPVKWGFSCPRASPNNSNLLHHWIF